MFLICVGAVTTVTLSGKALPRPAVALLAVLGTAGLLTAVFSGKRLRYRFDLSRDTAVIEYPKLMNTRLDTEEFRISDLKELEAYRMGLLQEALTRSDTWPSLQYHPALGFVLEDGRTLHSGIYSTDQKEIGRVLAEISAFFDVPIKNKTEQ
jgi:hypothetical protein